MPPDRWRRLQEIFHRAMEAPGNERPSLVVEACGDDLTLRQEIEDLLKSQDRIQDFLETPAAVQEADAEWIGRRLGPYRIARQIGRGGMGAVYLADRVDEQYQAQVAIKLIGAEAGGAALRHRFLAERQILANLHHPNIAGMLDGGATPEGLAYIVMEYIQGEPIDRYCQARSLSVPERLELFRTVCAAVHCAHQHLIVHRDIKPANILVAHDGQPKLLDFGIAKLLTPEPQDFTATATLAGALPMTPAYASPEQVQGVPVTIATDIYSLGVVLYELLAGCPPYELNGKTAQEVMAIVGAWEPPRPSLAAGSRRRAIEGDLDHIVLKALRKEPQERYTSAAEFSDDIHRHLEGLPVIARRGTLRYRSAKFFKRHKAAIVSAALLAASLVGGVVATTRQAAVARAERALAVERLNDTRRLGNSLVFELQDAIRDLPGALPARELLIRRALDYLDGLARQAGADRTLQRELATAYERIGDVQGDTWAAIPGNGRASMESYRKALDMRKTLLDAASAGSAEGARDRLDLAAAHERMGNLQALAGDAAGAVASYRLAIATSETLLAADSKNSQARLHSIQLYNSIGDLQGNPAHSSLGRTKDAIESYRTALRLTREWAASDAANPKIPPLLAAVYMKLSQVFQNQDPPQADEYHRKAMALAPSIGAAGGSSRGVLWLGNDSPAGRGAHLYAVDTNGAVLRTLSDLGVSGIAFDGSSLYFNSESTITRRSLDGATVLETLHVASTNNSEDLAWDCRRQRIWRIDHDNRLRRIDPLTRAQDQVFVLPPSDPAGVATPLAGLGVAYDAKRDLLYVSFCKAGCDFTSFPGGVIMKVNPGTGAVTGQLFRTANGIHTAGLAYEPATDTLWVGDLNVVRRMTLSGAVVSTIPTPVSAFVDGLEFVSESGPDGRDPLRESCKVEMK